MLKLPKDREIAAIVPVYGERGDCTCLHLRDGRECLLPVQMKTVLRMLARRHGKVVPLMREWAAQRTHGKMFQPLPFGVELVLAPFKAREPRVTGDSTLGGVNMSHLAGVGEMERSPSSAVFAAALLAGGRHRRPRRFALLRLRSGRHIPALWSQRTLHKHLKEARLVHAILVREMHEAMLYELREHIENDPIH